MKTSLEKQELADLASNLDDVDRLAEWLKALADVTRLQMIHMLMARGEMCVCEFMSLLELTQSNASFHLKTLKHAGFVTARKHSKWMYYTLRRDTLDQCSAVLGNLLSATMTDGHKAGLSERPICDCS